VFSTGKCIALFVLLVAQSYIVGAEEKDKSERTSFDIFVASLNKFRANNSSLEGYEELQKLYRAMQEEGIAVPRLWFGAQQLAMIDTFFGEYHRAEERQYQLNPGYGRPKDCPQDAYDSHSAVTALPGLIADRDIVLINESHTRISTRAMITGLLPILKELGFKTLAIEALSQDAQSASVQALQDRGYPLNNFQAGYYLREPVMGELVREAIASGFKLMPFELAGAGNREQREEHQAEVLAEFIRSNPEAKLAVISGYSHINKSDGWMAERLQQKVSKPILSIDQTSRVTGCKQRSGHDEPFVFLDEHDIPWSASPDNVDLTIIHSPAIDGMTKRPAWLTLGGLRKATDIGNNLCGEIWPCQVSAYYLDENSEALPADQLILEDSLSSAWLYLRPGKYRIKAQNINGDFQEKIVSVH
jgi:hypothetical protein